MLMTSTSEYSMWTLRVGRMPMVLRVSLVLMTWEEAVRALRHNHVFRPNGQDWHEAMAVEVPVGKVGEALVVLAHDCVDHKKKGYRHLYTLMTPRETTPPSYCCSAISSQLKTLRGMSNAGDRILQVFGPQQLGGLITA